MLLPRGWDRCARNHLRCDDDLGAGGGGGSEPAPIVVSFVAEQGAGQGPALLRMFNDTEDQVLSISLNDGQAFAFYLVDPLASTDYVAAASADLLADAILSLHTTDGCVRKAFGSMEGPLSLEPGHAYSMHVTVIGGFAAKIVEEPMPEPFVALRAVIRDPHPGAFTGVLSKLSLASAGAAPLEFEDLWEELPAPYVRGPTPPLELTSLRFVDRGGVMHESVDAVPLDDSFGYTVYVGDAAHEGAVATRTLEPVPE